jgi:hypothetical protein
MCAPALPPFNDEDGPPPLVDNPSSDDDEDGPPPLEGNPPSDDDDGPPPLVDGNDAPADHVCACGCGRGLDHVCPCGCGRGLLHHNEVMRLIRFSVRFEGVEYSNRAWATSLSSLRGLCLHFDLFFIVCLFFKTLSLHRRTIFKPVRHHTIG